MYNGNTTDESYELTDSGSSVWRVDTWKLDDWMRNIRIWRRLKKRW